MSKVVIFKNDEGGISILSPTAEGLSRAGGDIVKLANKDVPHGKAYKIVDHWELPADRTYRAAWDIDEAELVDGTGSESNDF